MARRQADILIRNVKAAAEIAAIGGASKLRIYDGNQVLNKGDAETANLLFEFICNTPFAAAPVAGSYDPNAPQIADVLALATTGLAGVGVAAHYVHVTSGGAFIEDGTVGLAGSGADIIMTSVEATTGIAGHISTFTRTSANP